MLPGFYNHNYQILQTPDYVVILVEMIHDARIIPLDGRAHLSPQIGQWLGDSRGRWEGDTLVVETTNLTRKGDQRVRYLVQAGSEQGRVVERFTRVAADRIDYRFTVHRPLDVREPVDRRHTDGAARGRNLRVRVPRGELRAGEHPGGRPRGRAVNGIPTMRASAACVWFQEVGARAVGPLQVPASVGFRPLPQTTRPNR